MSRQLRKKEKREQESTKPSINYLLYAFLGFIVIILPVLYHPSTLDLQMMPRILGLSLFLFVFSIVFIFRKTFLTENFSLLRQKIFLVLGLWLLVSLVTLAFSTNPIEGIYDIVKVNLTIIIAILGSILFIRKDNWFEILTRFVVVSAIITSIVGFVQYYMWVLFPIDPTIPYGGKMVYRVVGVMAHKNLFSLSLFMMLPFAVYGSIVQKGIWRVLSVVASTFVLILIVLLQARATWVGFMFASATVVLLLAFFGKSFGIGRKLRLSLLAVTFLGVVAVGGVVFLAGMGSNNQYIKQLRSITDPKAPQNIHRVNVWISTIEMIKDKPLVGFGPVNWKLHVGYYFKGRFTHEDQVNWQRPHNDFLWIFAEKGIFGFILYLSIFGFLFYYLGRVMVRSDELSKKIASFLLIALLVGYLAASSFDFPYERVFHQAFLGIIIAGALAFYHSIAPAPSLVIKNRVLVGVPVLLVLGFGIVYGYQCVNQEKNVRLARNEMKLINQILPMMKGLNATQQKNATAMVQKKWQEVNTLASKAETRLKNLDPQANPITYYRGLAYLNLGDMKNGLKYCLDAYNRHPGSIRALNSLGAVYFKMNQLDEAEKYLTKSINIVASHDAIQNLSAVYFEQERYKEAYKLIEQTPKVLMSEALENNMTAIKYMLQEKHKVNPENKKK